MPCAMAVGVDGEDPCSGLYRRQAIRCNSSASFMGCWICCDQQRTQCRRGCDSPWPDRREECYANCETASNTCYGTCSQLPSG